ncbi:MAG: FtsX-like permease family protein [Flavobacteriaceae bacterium]|nr:FtsX-like permease family protein [Flavobacteriaceae bacterium]
MNTFPLKLASKYVFSGKNAIEVNVISWIAFLALGFVTACLFIIMSVFSGLESVNLQFYSNINPDLKVSPVQGKVILSDSDFNAKLHQIEELPGIEAVSKIIEERAFIQYNDKQHIISVKGVDENFNQIFGLDSLVKIGNPLTTEFPDEIIIGPGISSRLSLFPNPNDPVLIYVPKPGKGLITGEEDAFNYISAFATGIFFINDRFEGYAFSNLALAQQLLNYPENQFSYIEIKTTKAGSQLKNQIQQILGNAYKVQTRQEIDAAFLKMMNMENLIIYMIFVLVLIIASFNLAGSIAILILDKKPEAITLHSMGLDNRQLRRTYFITGMLITGYALLFGLVIGSAIAWLQTQYQLVMVSPTVAFPVKFTLQNYLITILSVLGIGAVVSWFVSRNAKIKASANSTGYSV